MKILVTGTEGYLGSLLAPRLLEAGHDLVAVDTGYYKAGWLYHGIHAAPHTLCKDIRRISAADLEGVEAVVHMAELSNDPAGQLAPDVTYEINHLGSVRLARLAKAAGATRFVYTSSCSVYGVGSDGYLTERSPVNPQTAYAICKTLVERDVGAMADDDFSPTFLRNATAYGASPRMRFDLVLNNLAGLAWTAGQIAMVSDGTPWRPLAHAHDLGSAIIAALHAPRDAVHGQVFNVGHTAHNYRVRDVAQIVAEVFPGCRLSFGNQGSDNRSYRVSFDKIHQQLPGFRCVWDAASGAEQLRDIFESVDLSAEDYGSRGFTRLKQLEYLIRTGQLDADLLWTPPCSSPKPHSAAPSSSISSRERTIGASSRALSA